MLKSLNTVRQSPVLIQSGWVLLATLSAFVAYCFLVVPHLERNIEVQRPIRDFSDNNSQSSQTDRYNLAQWIPADGWEHDRCKVLTIDGGTILFQDYLPRDDGLVEVFPFTLIIDPPSSQRGGPRAQAGGTRPIILRATDRALLKFDGDFNLGSEFSGKLNRAQLQGDVHVFRLPGTSESGDGFSLWTSNVQLSPTRISSLEEVRFQYGKSQGLGRNFTIDLRHDAPPTVVNGDFSRISGMRRLEVAFVKYLQLDTSSATTPNDPSRKSKALQGPIQVTCRGPFHFDFDSLRAVFDRDVFVQSLDSAGDSLRAQVLELEFDRQLKDGAVVGDSDDGLADMSLRRIRASGQPARLALPSRKTEAHGQTLEYDLSLQQLVAADPTAVHIEQPGFDFTGRHVQYRWREDQSLGPMLARGPGRLIQSFADGTTPPRLLEWQEQLSIEAVEGRKLITIQGAIRFLVEEEYEVRGDWLRAWLHEQRNDQPNQESTWTYQPIRVEVDGNVELHSPRLAGTTGQMTLQWPAAEALNLGQAEHVSSPRRYRAFRLPWSVEHSVVPIEQLSQEQDPGVAASFQPLPQPAPRPIVPHPDQMRFQGDRVRVMVQQADDHLVIDQVEIDGRVIIRRPSTDPGLPDPMTIEGDQLRMTPQGNELFHVTVRNHATLRTPEMVLQSEELHLDQKANRAWAPRSGDLTITPQAKLPPGEATEVRPDFQKIHVVWQGGIVFDGETIYFEHLVRTQIDQQASGQAVSRTTTQSEALSLLLTRPINLAQSELAHTGKGDPARPSTKSSPEVDRLIFVNQLLADQRVFPAVEGPAQTPQPVLLEKETKDAAGQLLEKQQLSVPRLIVYAQQGTFQATGPGSLSSWRRGNSQGTGIFRQASTSRESEPSNRLSYLHVDYDSSLGGSGELAQVEIRGRVRAVQAPVDRWDERAQFDQPQLPTAAYLLTSDKVEVAQWTPRGTDQAHVELIATGNARLRGEAFEALAHRLSYNQANDILEIDGGDREDARLHYQQDPRTRDRIQLAAQKIRYRPSDQWMEVERARNATIQRGGR